MPPAFMDKERKYIVNLASKFIGIPYIYGGSNPKVGLDCSGLVIWCLQVFEILSSGDWTAHSLSKMFAKTTEVKSGNLVCYGTPERIVHIGIVEGVDANGVAWMIGANGGDSKTLTEEDAIKRNAMVKRKPVNYRKDFQFYVDITQPIS